LLTRVGPHQKKDEARIGGGTVKERGKGKEPDLWVAGREAGPIPVLTKDNAVRLPERITESRRASGKSKKRNAANNSCVQHRQLRAKERGRGRGLGGAPQASQGNAHIAMSCPVEERNSEAVPEWAWSEESPPPRRTLIPPKSIRGDPVRMCLALGGTPIAHRLTPPKEEK